MPYPAFPVKAKGKGRRNFPAEDPALFKKRVEVMAAYLRSLTKVQARFKDGRKHFMLPDGRKVDRRAVNNLFSQLGADMRDLAGYYKAAKTKCKTRDGLGGFALPSLTSQKMIEFLRAANLGPIYNADGSVAGDDLHQVLPFLNDAGYNGVVGGGVLMALMSVYEKNHNLTANAVTNQQRAAAGVQPDGSMLKPDGSWLGVDQTLATVFAEEIQAGTAAGQLRLAAEQAAGGGEGQVRKLTSKGKTAKPAIRLKNGEYRPTQLFHAFRPDNFRWSDFSAVFVTPNVSKDKFRSVNPNADVFFPVKGVTAGQAVQIAAYDAEISALKDANQGGSIDHINVASRAAGTDANGLSAANAPLFARAQNASTQQTITNSKKGLKAIQKAQAQGQA